MDKAPLSVKTIVTTFGAPIREEHAWAILFLGLTRLNELMENEEICYVIRDLEDVYLTHTGDVARETFLGHNNGNGQNRSVMLNFATGVAELGVAVYDALDWKLNFERQLSHELEDLIDLITSADDSDQNDEGIDIGEDEVNAALSKKIINACLRFHNLGTFDEATRHFRDVCKKLVEEADELVTVISSLSSHEREKFEKMEKEEWAGVFNSVMNEVVTGVNLRSVENVDRNINFEPTPYEDLMNDIRSQKAVLKTPEVSESSEPATRDKLMEFIRSKPKLKPAGDRKLSSRVVDDETPAEKLMSDIRTGKARQSLRRTKTKLKTSHLMESVQKVANTANEGQTKVNGKILITIDDQLHTSMTNFDDDDEETTPVNSEDEADDTVFNDTDNSANGDKNEMTLQEVCHIRRQIAQAEMEQKNLTSKQRQDLDDGKVCFKCIKTKFAWYCWAYNCQVCKRKVCKNCCTQMKLPSSNVPASEVSVLDLSSQFNYINLDEDEPLDEEDSDKSSFNRNQFARGSLKCPPKPNIVSTPLLNRSKTLTKSDAMSHQKKLKEHQVSKLNCVSTSICLDCKELLFNVIWSGRSPSKRRTIHDLKSVTISKRRPSRSRMS